MAGSKQARDPVEGRPKIVVVTGLGRTGMHCHAYAYCSQIAPIFIEQGALRIAGGLDRIER